MTSKYLCLCGKPYEKMEPGGGMCAAGHRIPRIEGWLPQLSDIIVPSGSASAAASSGPSASESEARKESVWRTPDDLLSSASASVPWVWQGFLAGGSVSLLAGREKGGKSTLLFALLSALSSGRPLLGRAVQPTRALLLSEEPDASLAEKVKRFCLENVGNALRMKGRSDFRGRPHMEDVVADAVREGRRCGAGLIAIDTLAHFGGLAGDAENAAGAVSAVMAPLLQAAGEGFAVLVVHHANKKAGEVRGSTAIAAAVDSILTLSRPPDGPPNHRRLDAVGRFAETPPTLLLELAGDTYRVIDAPADQPAAGHGSVLAVLPSDGAGRAVSDIAAAAGLSESYAASALARLVASGQVERLGSGRRGDAFRFRLADGGETNQSAG